MQLSYSQRWRKISESLINAIVTLELENLSTQMWLLIHCMKLALNAHLNCLFKLYYTYISLYIMEAYMYMGRQSKLPIPLPWRFSQLFQKRKK